MSIAKKTLALVILDGWGYRKDAANNAVINANTPIMDKLWKERPHTLITASGTQVGLPNLQMGNSEVGHTNIGAGRIVYQDLTRINKEIEDGTFFENKVLVSTIDKTIAKDKALHVMGLLSPGGVHSHENHIMATLKMAHDRGAKQIYFHAFLDGRDTPPKSALASLQKIDSLFASLGHGKTASIIGRYFAMDRDNNWDRVSCAYNLLTQGRATYNYKTATEALTAAYSRNENDEFVQATTIGTPIKINDDDSIIFMNFRADRARELTRSFLPGFNQFQRKSIPKLNDFVMLTEYAADIKYKVAFPPEELTNTLGEWLAKLNKTQLRISETEKYAHVTFFLNGGVEQVFTGEDRILINSPKVATYDLQPEMSSSELTDNLVAAIASQKYDVIICNYPNGDMVGHTGVYSAAIKACEAVDACIGKVTAAIEAIDGQMLITADHGNAELMVDPITKEPYTAHTNLPVPLIYVGQQKGLFSNAGRLCDLAPTMLRLIDLEIPKEMTGNNLFKRL